MASRLLQSAILDQRAAMEELAASNLELYSVLVQLAPESIPFPDSAPVGNNSGQPHSLSDTAGLDPDPAIAQIERDAEHILRTGREVVRESRLIRSRSKMIRSALGVAPVVPVNLRKDRNALSKREQSVLALIVKGKSSREIAVELGISFKTAVTHRASIMGKLDVHELASLVREAIRLGLV